MKRKIWIKGQFIAFHRWAASPVEVAFLQNWHRHVFHVKVTLPVAHDDRDLEFFMVQSKLNHILERYKNLHHDKSCEMFAEEIKHRLDQVIGREAVERVEVSEDDENGAIVEWELTT